jgi:hypothetical protein
MSYHTFEKELSKNGVKNFNYIKSKLVDDQYAGITDFNKEHYIGFGMYKGKLVFGYLRNTVYANGALVLHRINNTAYNSFSGSVAEDGDWILFSKLTSGAILHCLYDQHIKNYVIKHYGWSTLKSKNTSMKQAKKNVLSWETTFKAKFPEFEEAIITRPYIEFNGIRWEIETFKNYIKAGRVILAKYEKEYGNI